MSKALDLMKSKQTLEDKANEFIVSVERDVQKQFIEELEHKIEDIEDKISDAKQFSLTTNINKGQTATTRSECKEKFLEILSLTYELRLAKAELKVKKQIFDEYFDSDLSEVDED